MDSIPSDLLPSILSYIPLPHLQYRLVNKEWDSSMKIAHSFGKCHQCRVACRSHEELHTRMRELTISWRQDDHQKTTIPWPLQWRFIIDDGSKLSDLPAHLERLEHDLIPYLDALQTECCYSITLEAPRLVLTQPAATSVADWCLGHSKPTEYNFFLSIQQIRFTNEEEFLSLLCAPSMKHISGLRLDHYLSQPEHRFSFSPLRDSETVSNLQSLSIHYADFRSQDAECLAHSPYLTNLTHLSLQRLRGLYGMTGAERGCSFDAIICSPIMKNVRSFEMGAFSCNIGYGFAEAFAQSKYLKNLKRLALFGLYHSEEFSLEPLLLCDATMPSLTSFELKNCPRVPESVMAVIMSPTSSLFNRIESLDFSNTSIPIASMRMLCVINGLRSLKTRHLQSTCITDEHIHLLVSASSGQFSNLRHLGLRWNAKLTNTSIIALYSAKNLSSLQSIDLRRCENITADVLEEIRDLPPRPSLRTLSLSFSSRIMDEEARLRVTTALKQTAPQLHIDIEVLY